MGKQVGSRFRQITRKITTGKFWSGIVFTICTKKRPWEPETGIKDGTWISIWSILFRSAKIGLPNIPFPCSISFSTGFSGNFVNGEQPLHLIIHCRYGVRAIRTPNIRLFWNCFALNFGICLLNNSSMIEIQNKPLKWKKDLRSRITLSLLEQLLFCWLLNYRMNVFVTFLKHQ